MVLAYRHVILKILILEVPLDSRYTQVRFNLISVQVCFGPNSNIMIANAKKLSHPNALASGGQYCKTVAEQKIIANPPVIFPCLYVAGDTGEKPNLHI